jgi:dimethylargininase
MMTMVSPLLSQTLYRSTCSSTIIKRLRTTVAITREIPDSFIDAVSFHYNNDHKSSSSSSSSAGVVSLQKAREQHTNYIDILKQHLDGKVINLPAIESHPDCLFVEDTMVAIDDTAVITSMGHESRRGEVDSIKSVLLEDLQGRLKNVYDMNDNYEADIDSNSNDMKDILPTCDGGDVLYTGRHLFVGITDRTNEIGFEHLRKVLHSIMDC